MFKHYLKIAVRNLRKHKAYSFSNIAGLAVGMTCCILILLYVQDELSYDRYHINADRIYRLERNSYFQGQYYQVASTAHPYAPALKREFPEVLEAVRFWPLTLHVRDQNRQY